MSAVVATVRPDNWNFPLLLHVLGALTLVGALLLSATLLIVSTREGGAALSRSAFRAMLIGVIPAWILMRASAASIVDKEGLKDAKLTWLDIGFTTADLGLVLILVATGPA